MRNSYVCCPRKVSLVIMWQKVSLEWEREGEYEWNRGGSAVALARPGGQFD